MKLQVIKKTTVKHESNTPKDSFEKITITFLTDKGEIVRIEYDSDDAKEYQLNETWELTKYENKKA